eukprot:1527183-Rhodomonas_salina.1
MPARGRRTLCASQNTERGFWAPGGIRQWCAPRCKPVSPTIMIPPHTHPPCPFAYHATPSERPQPSRSPPISPNLTRSSGEIESESERCVDLEHAVLDGDEE